MRKFAFVLYRLEMAIYFERLVRACAGTVRLYDSMGQLSS
jgi:hypothetical protein